MPPMLPQRKEPQTSNVGEASNAAGLWIDGERRHSKREVRGSFLILLLIRNAVWATVTEVDFHNVHRCYGQGIRVVRPCSVVPVVLAWLRLVHYLSPLAVRFSD